jgi:hypothetical protein
MKRVLILSMSLLLMTGSFVAPTQAAAKYKNCTEMRKAYPSGVAKTKKAAKSSGAKYAPSIYSANSKMDRDKDGAACEA